MLLALGVLLLPTCAPGPDPPLPPPDHREILGLLRGNEFSRLDGLLTRYQEQFERNVEAEVHVERAIKSFWIADPAAEELLDEWVAAHPRSAMALLARGKYLARRGWGARGGRWAADTPRWRFQQMGSFFERSAADALSALELNPRLTEAYRILQGIAQAVGRKEDCQDLTRRALSEVPASFRIYEGQLSCLEPRWGGSYEEMAVVIGQLAAEVENNPRLATLVGYPDWDRARALRAAKKHEQAIEHLDRALSRGPYWRYYEERAENHYRLERYLDSWKDLERALELQPDYPPILIEAVYTLNRLRRVEEVAEVLAVLEAIDPGEEDLPSLKQRTARMLVVLGHQAAKEKQYDRSIDLFNRAVGYDARNHEAFFWRGRSYLATGRHDEALVDFRKAIEIDPRHYPSYVNIDHILAKRGHWEEILRSWSDYLALAPSDARAYLERAGTNRHAGRRDKALADLLRACRLESEEACRLYEQERTRAQSSGKDGG